MKKGISHFFCYLSRMRLIKRWGLMFNSYPENVQEHSARVAMIAHCLATISKEVLGQKIEPDRVAVLALYHDTSEVFTGDLPTPIKYYSDELRDSYKKIERSANQKLLDLVPDDIKGPYQEILLSHKDDHASKLVKAADKLCALMKCMEELRVGNSEFKKAEKVLQKKVNSLNLPEVKYFQKKFLPSFNLSLDEMAE